MTYKSFNLEDWIEHISGVIEDELTLDGNEMRDLVWFLTTLKQQPSEDCISREQAIKQCGFGMTNLLIADCLRRLPSVTSQRPKGKWIKKEIKEIGEFVTTTMIYEVCSNCGIRNASKYKKYCPNCGSYNGGGEDDNF